MSGGGWLHRALVIGGGGALLLAMGVDALAVVGRHVGLPLLGSIELVQVAVLVAGAAGLLVATRAGVHASVHLLVDRLPARVRSSLRLLGLLLGALLFAALCAASVWIAADLWHGHEESEWLHLPWRPLRVLTVLAAAAVTVAFVIDALQGKRP